MHPKVPIHTISFNCSDREANQFLCDLAKESGGRFHYWSENGVDGSGPAPWEVSRSNDLFTCEIASAIVNLISLMLHPWGALTLAETETDKNGLYRIVWRCSYWTEKLMPLGTVAI